MESTLVTINDLKTLTSIGQHIEPEMLVPFLLVAQQMYLQPVLSDGLYFDIINRFDNNQLTGDTQTLYEEYIINALAYSTWYAAAPFLNYKTQRTGISTQTTDVLTPATIEEMNLYIGRVSNMKDHYLNRLEDYLMVNQTLFPLYRPNNVEQKGGGNLYLGFKYPIRGQYWDYHGGHYDY